MKKLLSLFVALIYIINANAQFAVTTNSGSGLAATYPSLAAAITALNAAAITSPVVITCPTGTETSPAGGYSITASGTATNTITIVGNGAANSIITAPTTHIIGEINDAIIKIIGADYVTIEGFGMYENGANTTIGSPVNNATTGNNMTEFGVALFYSGTTAATANGSQFCTIKNNTIDLNKSYVNTFGIYSNNNHNTIAVTAALTPSSTAGNNSGLVIIKNTITDVNLGISIIGPAASGIENDGLIIGGSASDANLITNYGTTTTSLSSYVGNSGTIYSILIRYVKNFTVSYNSITNAPSSGPTVGTVNCIYLMAGATGVSLSGTIVNRVSNNTISAKSAVITGVIRGIFSEGSIATNTTTMSIDSNNFVNLEHSVSGTAAISGISNTAGALNTNINKNTFTNLTCNTTNNFTFINNSFTRPANAVTNVNNNSIVTAFNKTGAGGIVLFYNSSSSSPPTATETNTGNNFSNVTLTGATILSGFQSTDGSSSSPFGPVKIITNNTFNNITGGTSALTIMRVGFSNAASTTSNISGNTVSNINGAGNIIGIDYPAGRENLYGNSVHSITTTGASTVTGVFVGSTVTGTIIGSAASTKNVYKNKIYNLTANNATGIVYGIRVVNALNANISNNVIGDLKAPISSATSNSVIGIFSNSINPNSFVNIYFNSIFLNATSSGTNFSTAGILQTYDATSTTASLDLKNNIIMNKSTAMGSGRVSAFVRTSAVDLNNYATTSNNNIFYSGTPSANKLIFYDGTNSDQLLTAFQARVASRETNSKTEDVPFQSIVGSNANFLRIALGTITAAESGATTTTTPAIVDDYWSIGRPFASPVNGGTAADIGASEFDGINTAGAWVGTTSTDWNVASNWFDGVVPTSTISVVIPSAPTNQPVISSSTTAAANSIIINAGASLTEQSNSLASIATITNNGTLNYNGSTAQTIGSIATINNLTINNTAGVTLTAPATVNGVLTFTDGILTTASPTALLTLSAGATVSGTIDNTRFVNGPITKCGSTDFTFPIGKTGTLNRLGLASIANLSATDCYTAEYFQTPYSNLTVSGALTGVSTGEYWDISRAGATTANVTLNWTDNIFSGVNSGNFDLAKLSMAHFNSTSTFWEVQSTSSLGGTALNGSITAVAVSSFSPFALGSITATTLPIAVNSFTASKQSSNTNAINWKATCTGASVSFELQRSTNGIVFVPVNTLTATQARCAAPFNYVDNYNATSPITYYKLKVISNTGEVKYSQIVAINNKNANANTMALYPNIVKGNAVLVVESKTTTNVNFVITDAKGAIVRRFTESLSEGANAYPINVSNLSLGSYQITGIIDGALKTIRFIKE